MNIFKPQLVPVQRLQYQDMDFPLHRHLIFLPVDKCQERRHLMLSLVSLRTGRRATMRQDLRGLSPLSTLLPRGLLTRYPTSVEPNIKLDFHGDTGSR